MDTLFSKVEAVSRLAIIVNSAELACRFRTLCWTTNSKYCIGIVRVLSGQADFVVRAILVAFTETWRDYACGNGYGGIESDRSANGAVVAIEVVLAGSEADISVVELDTVSAFALAVIGTGFSGDSGSGGIGTVGIKAHEADFREHTGFSFANAVSIVFAVALRFLNRLENATARFTGFSCTGIRVDAVCVPFTGCDVFECADVVDTGVQSVRILVVAILVGEATERVGTLDVYTFLLLAGIDGAWVGVVAVGVIDASFGFIHTQTVDTCIKGYGVAVIAVRVTGAAVRYAIFDASEVHALRRGAGGERGWAIVVDEAASLVGHVNILALAVDAGVFGAGILVVAFDGFGAVRRVVDTFTGTGVADSGVAILVRSTFWFYNHTYSQLGVAGAFGTVFIVGTLLGFRRWLAASFRTVMPFAAVLVL
jgi:hypothetical protein